MRSGKENKIIIVSFLTVFFIVGFAALSVKGKFNFIYETLAAFVNSSSVDGDSEESQFDPEEIDKTVSKISTSSEEEPFTHEESSEEPGSSEAPEEPAEPVPTQYIKPTEMIGVWLVPGVDFYKNESDTIEKVKSDIDKVLNDISKLDFNSIVIPLQYKGKVIYNSDLAPSTAFDAAHYIIEKASQLGLFIYASYDLNFPLYSEGRDIKFDLSDPESQELIQRNLVEISKNYAFSGIMLNDYCYNSGEGDYGEYILSGGGIGFETWKAESLTALVSRIRTAVKTVRNNIYFGLSSNAVWAHKSNKAEGSNTKNAFEDMVDGFADTRTWVQEKLFDFVCVKNHASLQDPNVPFETVAKWWNALTAQYGVDLYINYSADNAASGKWKSPDQLTKQVVSARNLGNYKGGAFYSASSLLKDPGGSTSALCKLFKGQVKVDYISRVLTITSPTSNEITTYESTINIRGGVDPNFPAFLNGKPLEVSQYGYFAIDAELKPGKNVYKFEHKGSTVTITVTRKIIVLKDINPTADIAADGESLVSISAVAHKGATVYAMINGKKVVMQPQADQGENPDIVSDFQLFTGIYKTPEAKTEEQDLGQIVITGEYLGNKDVKKGGKIIVRAKPVEIKTTLVEVIGEDNETYEYGLLDDRSRPTNNTLPVGTIDMVEGSYLSFFDESGSHTYWNTASGMRLYRSKNGKFFTKEYEGVFPGDNSMSALDAKTSSHSTDIIFSTTWKIPFKINISPQNYANPYPASPDIRPDYTISSFTAEYLDIVFAYTTGAQGLPDISASRVIKSLEWIKGDGKYTLRIRLKKTGGFFGYRTYYDEDNQLVLSIKEMPKISEADNEYGYSLEGVRICLDPGHGGVDSGAAGFNPNYHEKVLNLSLAKKIRDKLESLGAEVFMTRSTDVKVSESPFVQPRRDFKPDLFISVHHDSATSSSAYGFSVFYYYPFSRGAGLPINSRLAEFYKQYMYPGSSSTKYNRGTKYYPFYVTRVPDCPALLIEYGFMSNREEYEKLILDSTQEGLANATVLGIIDYFESLNS